MGGREGESKGFMAILSDDPTSNLQDVWGGRRLLDQFSSGDFPKNQKTNKLIRLIPID